MKKIIAFILLSSTAIAAANAQSTKSTPLPPGGAISTNAVTYSLPQTVITTTFTVQHETIKKGPYARYAQKYLGAVAHLSDKEIYTIVGATLSYSSEADPSAVYALDNPDKTPFDLYYPSAEGFIAQDGQAVPRFSPRTNPRRERPQLAEEFDGVQIDKVNMNEPSLEEAAAQAARALFTLRQRRFDLVTGEAGENVYGAGMKAALEEMKRMEDEYIALFLGKRTVRMETKTVDAVPVAGKHTMIVCRFNETAGILPDNDLSGTPIVIEMTPENKTANTVANRAAKESRGTVFMRIADIANCRLMLDKTVLASERIPVYQFGQVVEVPVTSTK